MESLRQGVRLDSAPCSELARRSCRSELCLKAEIIGGRLAFPPDWRTEPFRKELELARIRLVNPGNHLYQGAFAGPVFAHHCVDSPFLDVEGNVLQCLDTREMLGDAVDFQNGSHGGR